MHSLALWHIFVAVAFSSCFAAFQWTAYAAATAQMVPRQQLGRANGAIEISRATAQIVAPLAAGFLMKALSLQGIILIDLVTFVIGVTTLFWLKIPSIPRKLRSANRAAPHLWQDLFFGWRYLHQRPGLQKLLFFFAIIYFALGALEVLFTPFFLTMGSPQTLGLAMSLGGCGWLLGSVLMSLWGGPANRIKGVLGFSLAQGGWLLLAGFKPSIFLAILGIFGYLFTYPFIASCSQAIWQSKVELALQGRVFSVKLMVEWMFLPLGYLMAGLLSDRVFEPLMAEGGAWSTSLGSVIGSGPGRGMALLCMMIGMGIISLSIMGYKDLTLRRLDTDQALLQQLAAQTRE